MNEPVKYTDGQQSTIVVADRGDYGCVVIVADDDGPERHVHVKGDFRRHTARALAGDGYRVISADSHERLIEAQAAQPDRPEPVDPCEVRERDLVEIDSTDGRLHRGPVLAATSSDFLVGMPGEATHGMAYQHSDLRQRATVRVLQSAQPDPDKVRAWVQWLADHGAGRNGVAETLVRAGLEVPSDG